MDQGRAELRGGWALLLASCAGFGLGLSGLPFYTAGVFLDPMVRAFGWTAAQAQSGLTVMLGSVVIMSPAAGLAADRFGARRIALVSIGLYALSFMSLALTTSSLLQYRLTWFLIAAAGAGTLPVIWTRTVNARFVERRGLALGLVLAGSGVTGFLTPPLAAWLIAAFGWRWAYVVLGVMPLLISWPLVYVAFRAEPSSETMAPEATPADPNLPGWDLREAVRTPQFWLIAICVGIVAGAVSGCITNLVKILVSHGLPRMTAVWVVGLVGLFVIVGRAGCGALIDRFRPSVVACAFFVCPSVACLLLVYGPPGVWTGGAAAALIGLAAGAEFDVLAYLIAAHFGLRRYGSIYGAASVAFAICSGAAPTAFAAVFDRNGSYDGVLLSAAAVFVVGAAGLLLLKEGPFAHRTSSRLDVASHPG